MPLPYFKIIKIMRWRNLHCACTIFHVCMLIRHNRDQSICKWQLQQPTDQILIPFVFWVHCHCCIPKNRLRACCAHNNLAFHKVWCGVNHILRHWSHLIRYLPQMPLLVFMLHFNIRKCRLMFRAKIHQLLPSVDHSIVPHFLKSLIYTIYYILIQRKS